MDDEGEEIQEEHTALVLVVQIVCSIVQKASFQIAPFRHVQSPKPFPEQPLEETPSWLLITAKMPRVKIVCPCTTSGGGIPDTPDTHILPDISEEKDIVRRLVNFSQIDPTTKSRQVRGVCCLIERAFVFVFLSKRENQLSRNRHKSPATQLRRNVKLS